MDGFNLANSVIIDINGGYFTFEVNGTLFLLDENENNYCFDGPKLNTSFFYKEKFFCELNLIKRMVGRMYEGIL